MLKCYLAGPGVFLPNPKEYGARKKAICLKHGFEGVFPIDAELELADKTPVGMGLTISLAN